MTTENSLSCGKIFYSKFDRNTKGKTPMICGVDGLCDACSGDGE